MRRCGEIGRHKGLKIHTVPLADNVTKPLVIHKLKTNE